MLEKYEKLGWKLVQVAHNGKNPIAPDWTNNGVSDRTRWADWTVSGYNLGVLTGRESNITVLDLDTKEIPRILSEIFLDTLVQRTNKGYHFFFQYEEALPTTRIDNLKMDILNDKRQCVIAPSVVNGEERGWEEEDIDPMKMPDNVKEWVLSQVHAVKNFYHIPECTIQEGNRNASLVQLGGILRKELNPRQTQFVINLINKRVLPNQLPQYEINAMCKSLCGYASTDLSHLRARVLDYLSIVGVASVNDLERATREEPEGIARVLYELQTDGYIIPYRKDYKFVKRPKWKTEFTGMGDPLEFKIPYFDEIANFCWGDMILVGSQTGGGKTHVAMNFIKQLVEQGIQPYYITTEAGSRFINIATDLGMKEGDFMWDTIINVENIQLTEKSVTILDWLMIEDKGMTDKVFQLLQDQLFKSGGVLIVFQQLKDFNHEWFAPNMCKQFPVLATRYIKDKDDYTKGKFVIDKIREAKGRRYTREIPCSYNWATKELHRIKPSFAPTKDWEDTE